jgi:hypothetical protein
MDYKDWTAKLIAFVDGLPGKVTGAIEANAKAKPPLTEPDLLALEHDLGVSLPRSVREFLLNGARAISATYSWTPGGETSDELSEAGLAECIRGGGEFLSVDDFAEFRADARSWAIETAIAEDPVDQERWLNSLPFYDLNDGDYLAIDLSQGVEDPPVLFLCHEDESWILSSSFSAFLAEWAACSYVSPRCWELFGDEPFFDKETRQLSGQTEAAALLQQLLA